MNDFSYYRAAYGVSGSPLRPFKNEGTILERQEPIVDKLSYGLSPFIKKATDHGRFFAYSYVLNSYTMLFDDFSQFLKSIFVVNHVYCEVFGMLGIHFESQTVVS